jgi:hypothetical protein
MQEAIRSAFECANMYKAFAISADKYISESAFYSSRQAFYCKK